MSCLLLVALLLLCLQHRGRIQAVHCCCIAYTSAPFLHLSVCSLLQQEALLAQLRECPSLRDLRQLLEGLAAALGGEQALPLAAANAPQATDEPAAAAEPEASPGLAAEAAAGDDQAVLAQQLSNKAAAPAPEPHAAAVEPAAQGAAVQDVGAPGSGPSSMPSSGPAADAAAGFANDGQSLDVPVPRHVSGVTLRNSKWQAVVYVGLTLQGHVSSEQQPPACCIVCLSLTVCDPTHEWPCHLLTSDHHLGQPVCFTAPHCIAGTVDRIARAVGCFVTVQEAGIARDLAMVWRQLALGAPLEAASEAYNARLPK